MQRQAHDAGMRAQTQMVGVLRADNTALRCEVSQEVRLQTGIVL